MNMVMRASDLINFSWKDYNSLIDSAISKKYFLNYKLTEQTEEKFDAFYVSKKYKLLYIPISKNASTSLKKSIDFEPVYQIPKVNCLFDLELDKKYKKEYKIFTIIRHPKDRWISGFNEFLCDLGLYLGDKTSLDILDELKNKKYIFDGHTLPQLKFIDYCFQPSSEDFEINLICMDNNIEEELSNLAGQKITLQRKNIMNKDFLKIKNYEFCHQIFNNICLKSKDFSDVYEQDYMLYKKSK